MDNNKKYTVSTDTDLHLNMLADNTKLKVMPDIDEKSHDDFKISMSNKNNVDSPDSINLNSDSDSSDSDDLKFEIDKKTKQKYFR